MSRSSTARLRVWSMPVDAAERKTLLCKALPDRPVVDGAENAHVERHGVAHDAAPDEIGVVLLDQRLGKGGEGKVRAAEKSRKAVERARVVARRPQPPFRSQPGDLPPQECQYRDIPVRSAETRDDLVRRVRTPFERQVADDTQQQGPRRRRCGAGSPTPRREAAGRARQRRPTMRGECGCKWRCGGPDGRRHLIIDAPGLARTRDVRNFTFTEVVIIQEIYSERSQLSHISHACRPAERHKTPEFALRGSFYASRLHAGQNQGGHRHRRPPRPPPLLRRKQPGDVLRTFEVTQHSEPQGAHHRVGQQRARGHRKRHPGGRRNRADTGTGPRNAPHSSVPHTG